MGHRRAKPAKVLCHVTEALSTADWVARSRAYRRNALSWNSSKPTLRLMILRLAMQQMISLIHRLLQLGSEAWEHRQELKFAANRSRSFRILEAATQNDLKSFFTGMLLLLLQFPQGILRDDITAHLQTLMFRLVSRSCCSMHQLLRTRRQGYPYTLFLALRTGVYDQAPPCLWDELTRSFRSWFPELTSDAQAALHALAWAIDLDIAAIEARHAASRRIITSVVQTWAPSMEHVSAEWTLRQMTLREAETQPSKEAAEPTVSAIGKPNRRQRRAAGKQPGARGGGGGAWRAFLHERAKGRKLSLSVIQET